MIKRSPDFFVLGAQKAGTTSLHDMLSSHPEVCLPKLKETQFFAFQNRFSQGLSWYYQQFPSCEDKQIIGEVCPDYMYFEGTAERIRTCVQSPKMIFIFRDPIQRAYSHYLMSARKGFENLTFTEALEAEDARLAQSEESIIYHSYLSRGRYVQQVETYKSVFPSAEFLFVKFEDLIDDASVGEQTLLNIYRFLGVSEVSLGVNAHSNAASLPRSKWLRDQLYGQSIIKSAIGLLLPQSFKEQLAVVIDRWNQKPIRKEEMGQVPSHFLEKALVETEQLQLLTGLNLDTWVEATKKLLIEVNKA